MRGGAGGMPGREEFRVFLTGGVGRYGGKGKIYVALRLTKFK